MQNYTDFSPKTSAVSPSSFLSLTRCGARRRRPRAAPPFRSSPVRSTPATSSAAASLPPSASVSSELPSPPPPPLPPSSSALAASEAPPCCELLLKRLHLCHLKNPSPAPPKPLKNRAMGSHPQQQRNIEVKSFQELGLEVEVLPAVLEVDISKQPIQ